MRYFFVSYSVEQKGFFTNHIGLGNYVFELDRFPSGIEIIKFIENEHSCLNPVLLSISEFKNKEEFETFQVVE